MSELHDKLSKFGLSKAEIKQVFSLLNTNENGSMDRAEFAAGFDRHETF
jgi:hypothetical protein